MGIIKLEALQENTIREKNRTKWKDGRKNERIKDNKLPSNSKEGKKNYIENCKHILYSTRGYSDKAAEYYLIS